VTRRLATGLIVVALGVCIVLTARFFHGPDRGDYLAKNERIVQALPLPPGAHETMRQILRNEDTVFGEQLSHTVGYTTYVTYAVPGTPSSKLVVAFYDRKLQGWQRKHWIVDSTTFGCFTKEGATVSVQPEGLDPPGATSPRTYGIAVDHDGGNCD
jgi:hypothetical protein